MPWTGWPRSGSRRVMSKSSRKRKLREKRDARVRHRWKTMYQHFTKCGERGSTQKNWGVSADGVHWTSHRCRSCGLLFIRRGGKVRIRGCGEFVEPVDAIQLLGAIGDST